MSQTQLIIIAILLVLGSFLFWYLFAKTYFQVHIRRARSQAITQSKSVHKGFNNEKIAPLLPGFNYRPRDMTFVGKGVDYIIFNWLSQWYVDEIIFLEVKTGKSMQNNNEKLIEQAIKAGRVRYEIFRR